MNLSIIIVNWNSREYLDSCLASIYQTKMELVFEVIVVDNASYDGSDLMIKEKYPDVKFIQSNTNGGFSYANNLGFKESCGDYLLFLNPDTQLVGNAVGELYRVFVSQNNVGIAGCTLINTDGSFQTSCIQAYPTILNQILDSELLRRLTPKSSLWGNSPLFEEVNMISEVEIVSGACLLVRRDVFEAVGQFNTDYFMYSEDLDLCFKVRQSGLRVIYAREPRVIHHGGGSTSESTMNNFSNIMMRDSIFKFLTMSRGKFYASAYRISMGLTAVVRITLLVAAAPIQLIKTRSISKSSISKWLHILIWVVLGEQYRRRHAPTS